MTISFNGIPVGIRTPGSFVEFSNVRAGAALPPWQTRGLLMGQKLAAGSQVAATKVKISQPLDGQALFGRGSMLDRMIQAYMAANPGAELEAMAVADPAGAAATFTLTYTGPSTAAGVLPLYIAGQSVPVAVTNGMTAAQLATAVAAAINANTDLPVTAAAALGVVTATVRWLGLSGNNVDIRHVYAKTDVIPAGLTAVVAAGVAGAGAVDLTAAIAAMGDKQYHFVAIGWNDTAVLAQLTTEMANRRGPMVQQQGHAFTAAKGSQGTLATLGQAQNSPDLCIAEAVGPVTTWERAAREAGLISFYGPIDPPRPLQTLALPGDIAPTSTERFTRSQRDLLLHDGISTHTVDPSGNVLLERPITTYQLNGAGYPDASYLDVTTMMTLNYLRFSMEARFAQKYPRHKLRPDDGTPVPPGQAIVTPKILSAELVALARDWEKAGYVYNVDAFKSQLVVQINAGDPTRVDALIPPNIVSGLRVFAGQIQFAF